MMDRTEAQYSGKHCVLDHIEGEIISPLYDTPDQADAVRDQMAGEYPRASVAYFPTRAQYEQWDRDAAKYERLEITSYLVVVDRKIQGQHVMGVPVSKAYATRAQAEARQAELLDEYPDARIREQVEFCGDQEHFERAKAEIVEPA